MTVTATILKGKHIPEEPGVYIMKDNKSMIIYIGKAKTYENVSLPISVGTTQSWDGKPAG